MVLCVDRDLATRLELAEATANALFVESRHALQPDVGACWIEIAGAKAMFDGVGSMISQTFGLGMQACPTAEEFAQLEQFFFDRDTDVNHEICPLGAPELLTMFRESGYFPVERSTVLYRELKELPSVRLPEDISVRLCEPSDQATWVETSVAGWDEYADHADMIREFGTIAFCRSGSDCWLVEQGGTPIATGGVMVCDDVGVLAGASTIPTARRRGAQSALLHKRLLDVRDRGCSVAMMVAEPGSASQRNAERNGFRIAYTRTKWAKSFASGGLNETGVVTG